jgi:hypothetical protein
MEFDALGRTEKAAIRSLDARIAQLPAADRASYWSVLRRYHQWVQGLSQEQRSELNSAPPNQRMRLVTQFRAEERTNAEGATIPLFLQVVDFTVMSPFESAHRLKAWFDLTPEKRAEIEKLPSTLEQKKRLVELSQQVKLGHVIRPSKAEEEALLAKIEELPQLKNWMTYPLKKADPTKQEKVKRRMADNYYFVVHPPPSVDPGNLMRFEAALPRWYRDQFEYLPPEEARRRLTILYRLVFPAGTEMPQMKAPGPPRTSPEPPRSTSAQPAKPARSGNAPGPNPF